MFAFRIFLPLLILGTKLSLAEYCYDAPAPEGCFASDTDWAGHYIASPLRGLESALHCQVACQLNPKCKVFTYIEASQRCWLKGIGAKGNVKQRSGHTSGPQNCKSDTVCQTDGSTEECKSGKICQKNGEGNLYCLRDDGYQDEAIGKQLLDSAKEGNCPGVEESIQQGASLVEKDATSSDFTFFHHLAVNGTSGCFEQIDQIVPYQTFNELLNSVDANGRTPFFQACMQGHLNVAKYLQGQNCDWEINDKWGLSPLWATSYMGHSDVVEFLISIGANVDEQSNIGQGPLHAAAHEGQEDIVRILLENGADIELTTENGFTPFLWSVYFDQLDIAKYLHLKDCNIEKTNSFDQSALIIATGKGFKDIVKFLLDIGLDPNWKNGEGKTAYDFTNDPEILAMLNSA